ncbi:unnamed protein product, partial [Closterium sp. NIES-54]
GSVLPSLPLPLFLAPGPPPVDPLPPQGPAPSGVSQLDAVEPVEVAADSGASGGAEPERAEPGGAGSGGAEPERAESGGAGSGVLSLSVRGLGVLLLGVLSLGLLGVGVWSLSVLDLVVLRVLCPGGSFPLHRSCASGLLAAEAVLLELEV